MFRPKSSSFCIHCLAQRSANYFVQAKSSLPPMFINKDLLEHNHTYLFNYCHHISQYKSRVEKLQQRLHSVPDPLQKRFANPCLGGLRSTAVNLCPDNSQNFIFSPDPDLHSNFSGHIYSCIFNTCEFYISKSGGGGWWTGVPGWFGWLST